ncbi:FliM/FliN family flagellar motor switch protein [Mariniblastus fucicola]|uniref:Flagellar motor switch protein FliN n=1 Tax=Mariniblastus fucicola TaxID=980251 RepID=A0A5B9PE23_9BACT|nr:FliM/FliN family flagellar motor switch protein [Mariniblastus fucicola]QEG23390.1 Flagellar motor switch protein FliN [Mariniblastus fucicola]
MADENTEDDSPEVEEAGAAATQTANAPADASEDDVRTPEFPDLKQTPVVAGAPGELNRLYDVQVTVAAELGRTSVPIQKLLGLTEGSVFELDRSISAPIELVAQGVPLGNGEVVVVDDSFAIRIKEIYANPS